MSNSQNPVRLTNEGAGRGSAQPSRETQEAVMQKLRFNVEIEAPVQKVWDTMLEDGTYRQWAAEFMPGSHFVGDWSEGSRILFLAPTDDGPAGMVSRIVANRPHEFVAMEHLGVVVKGREEAAPEWAGAREEYTLRDRGGRTDLLVEMDSNDDFADAMRGMWPRALQRLKELAEA
jgi:uncharacterized protein YndB with AHSA1/START domain